MSTTGAIETPTITKLAIVGSRTFTDYTLLEKCVDILREKYPNIDLIISGGAQGADKLGEKYADAKGIKTTIFYPDWKTHGKIAGILRNTDIIVGSDIVLAFWDGKSKGTLDSINKAKKHGKLIEIIKF